MNALMPRQTIEELVAHRDRAIALYGEAWDLLRVAEAKLKEAAAVHKLCQPAVRNYTDASHVEEVKQFYKTLRLPPREVFTTVAQRLVDIDSWSWIIERTDLERLMDNEAKNKLREQMKYVPATKGVYDHASGESRQVLVGQAELAKMMPPVDVDTIYATIEGFQAQAGTIFQRGIANVFSKLDRRFKSHDGFKVGGRIILTRVFSSYGGGLEYGETRDLLIDIERVFAVMDGVKESDFRSAIRALEESRRSGGYGPKQSYCETPYFRIRGFMNGNAHMWFTRDDLVRKVNKILAEWYGEVIGDGQAAEADPLKSAKLTPAKKFGFYPTPDGLADEVIEKAHLLRLADESQLRVLEPSAGTGQLARRCSTSLANMRGWAGSHDAAVRARWEREYRFDNLVTCVELQPELAASLKAQGYHKVYCQDFLKLTPTVLGKFDRIVMNPPFDLERDIDHVTHALQFLDEGGVLIAIMSAGTEWRETPKSVAFRALVKKMGGSFRELPAGSFASVGTNVNTCLLRIGGRGYW